MIPSIVSHKKMSLVPNEWERVPLSELCKDVVGGGTPKRSRSEYFGGKIPWVTPTDLDMGDPARTISESRTNLTKLGLDFSSAKLLPTGTVLFSSRATIGKIAIAGVPLCTNQGFANFICKDILNEKYLAFCLYRFIKEIKNLASSTTYLEVSKGKLREFKIPIPFYDKPELSLEMQNRIVARIESLLSEIKEARKLLDKMRKDAEGVLDASTNEIFANVSCIPLETIVESYKNGIYKPKEYYGEGYPSIRMFNIQNGRVNSEGAPLLKVTSQELELYGLVPDDILVNRVNSRELVGKSGLVPSSLGPCTFESKNIRVRLKRNKADPSFVVFGLNSRIVKEQILRMQKPAIGQATVNQTNLNNLKIPFIPDLKKQREIADRLRSIREEIEHLKSSFSRDVHLLDKLEQSILERAFRGEP